MAYFEFTTGAYKSPRAIYNVIHYILNPQKNPHAITNVKNICNTEVYNIYQSFKMIQKYWRKENGKRIRHFHVDFSPDCKLNYEDYKNIAYDIMDYFDEYQIIFALHEFDNDGKPCHKHIHFVFNPISYRNGKRFRLDKKKLRKIRTYIYDILAEYDITVELID